MYKRQLNFSATYVKQRNTHAPHLCAWHEIMPACKIDKILASNIVTYNKLKLRRRVSKECVPQMSWRDRLHILDVFTFLV